MPTNRRPNRYDGAKLAMIQVVVPAPVKAEVKRLARLEGVTVSRLCANLITPAVLNRLAALRDAHVENA